jgi:hypothetical protein
LLFNRAIINLWGEIESYQSLKRSTRKEIEINAKAQKVLGTPIGKESLAYPETMQFGVRVSTGLIGEKG